MNGVRRRRVPSDADCCTNRYEQLRDRAVRAGPVQDRNGLVVLVQRGIAAWLDVLDGLPVARPATVPSGTLLARPAEIEASALDILLGMVRAHMGGGPA